MCEVHVYKRLNNLAPRYLYDRSTPPSHPITTPSKTDVNSVCEAPKRNYGRRTFLYLGTFGLKKLNQQQREAKCPSRFE